MKQKWILSAFIGVTAVLSLALVLGLILWGGRTYDPHPENTQPSPTEVTVPSTAAPTEAPTTEPPTEAPTEPVTEPATEPTEAPEETTAPPATEPNVSKDTVPPTTAPPVTEDPGPQISVSAPYAYVYDCSTGGAVFTQGDPDAQIYPASITKLFTAWVALKHMSPETELTAGAELNFVAWDASRMYLQTGDTVTVKDLLCGMLLPSGNDAAYTLAAGTGRVLAGDPNLSAADAVQVFVDEMNREAQAAGMTASHFAVPDGYHRDDHYTTLRDLMTMAKLVLEEPAIMEICKLRAVTVTTKAGRSLYCRNVNPLVDPASDYYCPQAVGLKTGYTKKAGQCLLAAFEADGRYVLIGVFGAETRTDRNRAVLELWESFR